MFRSIDWKASVRAQKLIVKEFETAKPRSQEQLEAAAVLQEILARETPSIPIASSPLWNAHTERYWINWPQCGDPFPETAMWQKDQPGLLQEVVRMMEPGTGDTRGPRFNNEFFLLNISQNKKQK